MTFPPGGPSQPEEPEISSNPPANPEPRQATGVEVEAVRSDDPWSSNQAVGLTRLDDDFFGDEWVAPQPASPPFITMRRARRLGWELLQTLVLAVLIFFAVRAMAQNFRVEGSSMEPGLHDGQYLLVNKAVYSSTLRGLDDYIPLFHSPERGDVIVFRFPQDESRDFIKRVIGVPGDTVEIVDGTVFVNDVPLDEPYILGTSHSNYEKRLVPPGNYFVLGDNRNNSSDSRSWGFVPEENVIGQAMFTYWPLSELGGVGNHSIDLGFISIPLP